MNINISFSENIESGHVVEQSPEPRVEGLSEQEFKGLSALYAALAAKRCSLDLTRWSVPALTFTAQAFLLTLAYNKDLPCEVQVFLACTSFGIALASCHLFRRTSKHERIASIVLEQYEMQLFRGKNEVLKISLDSLPFPHTRWNLDQLEREFKCGNLDWFRPGGYWGVIPVVVATLGLLFKFKCLYCIIYEIFIHKFNCN